MAWFIDVLAGAGGMAIVLAVLAVALFVALFMTVPYFYLLQKEVNMEDDDWRRGWTAMTFTLAAAFVAIGGLISLLQSFGSDKPVANVVFSLLVLAVSLAMFAPSAVCLWNADCTQVNINWMRLVVPLAVLGSVGALSVGLVGSNTMGGQSRVEQLKAQRDLTESSARLGT